MNPMTLIVLALLTLFFFQINATFLAFLTLIVGLIVAVSRDETAGRGVPMSAGNYGAPGNMPPWPAKTKFEFRPNYPGDPDGDEWISGKAGQYVTLVGLGLQKLFGSSKK